MGNVSGRGQYAIMCGKGKDTGWGRCGEATSMASALRSLKALVAEGFRVRVIDGDTGAEVAREGE